MLKFRCLPLAGAGRLLCLALLLPGAGAGAEETEQSRKLEQLRERIESMQKDREALKARRDAIDRDLAGIERNYGRLAKTIAGLEAEARTRGQRLAELERQQAGLHAARRNQQRALAGQARAAYAAGREDWLKLLLNQEDPSRLTRVLAYHSYLNRARSSLLQGMDQAMASARRIEGELLAESERLKGTRERLAAEQSALNESRRDRHRLLAGLERALKDRDTELEQLREDEQRLKDLLTSIQLSGPDENPAGSPSVPPPLPSSPDATSTCPVTGRLAGQFGGPRPGGRWDGILIEAAEGTAVRAVVGGRVAFSDWLRGYGLLIIIDHGGGVMSLYAYNQSLYKEVGDPVVAGEVIAAVGASGGRSEPGLYFGIRQQGRPVDPMPWCRRTN
jgi:septal ring factor EnvC (AmiA/AmiB activator)